MNAPFDFRLPRVNDPIVTTVASHPTGPPIKSIVVLIVDTAADTRDMYHEFLRENERALVVTAPTAEIALELCHELRPDVIVADVGVRTAAGGSFWDDLRMTVGDRVRLVAITGATTRRPPAADAVLLKPVLPDALQDAVYPRA